MDSENQNNSNVQKDDQSWLRRCYSKGSELEVKFTENYSRVTRLLLINGFVFAYFAAALHYYLVYDRSSLHYCTGFGSLITLLGLIYFSILYNIVIKKHFARTFEKYVWRRWKRIWNKLWSSLCTRILIATIIIISIAIILYVDTKGDGERLKPLIGLSILFALGIVCSTNPRKIRWKPVFWGFFLQVIIGILSIRWDTGRHILECFAGKVTTFLDYGVDGAAFAYGNEIVNVQQVFAFRLGVIFFFSMIVEVLYYWGALQKLCVTIGSFLQDLCGVTIIEGTATVGCAFFGNTETILLIRNYLPVLTESEMHLLFSAGFASVSGAMLAAYVSFGADPSHLIAATVMSAPAVIMYAKMLIPETEDSLTSKETIQLLPSQDTSAISAATRGASLAIDIFQNIIANLIAFVAFVAFVNGVLGYMGPLIGAPELNLDWILGKIFIPLSWSMGVPWEECETVGVLIGLKTAVNEFVAYQKMSEFIKAGMLSPRAKMIATYAICGFSNPASGGIMIGAVAALAPGQRETCAKVVVRAFFAGCVVCFMTACVAGILMPESALLTSSGNESIANISQSVFINNKNLTIL